MSFLPIREENQEAPAGQTTNAPGGAPPPQTSGSAGGAQEVPKGAAAGSPTQFGSSASKLADYLSANEPQITQQAENITGQLNQRYGDVSQGITNAANQFGQQVQGGYAAPDQELISRAMQNPSEFAATPENVEAFQRQYNNTYSGPLSFENTAPYTDIQNQVGQAIQQGNLLSNEAGLQSYLQGQGNNPNRASATLDTLLLQGNPGAQALIRNAATKLGTLGGQLQTATEGANALVTPAQQQAQQSKEQARSAAQTAASNLANQVQNALTEATKKFGNNSTFNAIQAAISNGDAITPEQAQVIGIDPAKYARELGLAKQMAGIYNNFKTSLADYFTPGQLIGTPPTTANVASPEMYAWANALRTLTGGAGPNLPLDPTQINQAGTFNANVSAPKLDLAKAMGDISRKFSDADLNALVGAYKDLDPINHAAQQQRINKYGTKFTNAPVTYDETFQKAAQESLPYINARGPGYYNFSPAIMDIYNRLAQNAYQ